MWSRYIVTRCDTSAGGGSDDGLGSGGYPSSQEVSGISTSDYLWEERYPPCQGESFYNLRSEPIENSSVWGTVYSVEMLDYELTTKDAREGILGAIRAAMSG